MITFIAASLTLGLGLSLRANVVTITVIALLGGIGVFGLSMLLGVGLISSVWRVVVSIVCLEAGYFLGVLAQAARLIVQELQGNDDMRAPPRNDKDPHNKSAK